VRRFRYYPVRIVGTMIEVALPRAAGVGDLPA
jgi:hypothetical protein